MSQSLSGSPMSSRADVSPADAERRARDCVEAQPHLRLLGVVFASAAPGACELRLPRRPDLLQANGAFHEGAVGTLASAAGVATAQTLLPEGTVALTVEYKVNIMAPARGEALLARGQIVRSGKTVTVCRVDLTSVTGGESAPCATCLMTLMAVTR
ncbi:MAG TPA: PaaI family thioesterase [bacterium]